MDRHRSVSTANAETAEPGGCGGRSPGCEGLSGDLVAKAPWCCSNTYSVHALRNCGEKITRSVKFFRLRGNDRDTPPHSKVQRRDWATFPKVESQLLIAKFVSISEDRTRGVKQPAARCCTDAPPFRPDCVRQRGVRVDTPSRFARQLWPKGLHIKTIRGIADITPFRQQRARHWSSNLFSPPHTFWRRWTTDLATCR
jgi:hypothetical protein